MSDKDKIIPYYKSFCHWFGLCRPELAFMFQRGMMGVDQIKPYVRQWAEDITDK